MLRCSRCGELKPSPEFLPRRDAGTRGYTSWCRPCLSVKYKAYKEAKRAGSYAPAPKPGTPEFLYCARCGESKTPSEFSRRKDEGTRGYTSWCINCRRARSAEYKEANREKIRANQLARHHKNRRRCIEHYSAGRNTCACCGEAVYGFLTIDHINNDGAAHRKAIGTNLYSHLVARGFPEGFQVLCFNCNLGRAANKGTCPHEELA